MTKPGCAPLKAGYERAVTAKPKSWDQVEDLFLRSMEAFDANVASGLADMGDLQNGKGDFFNDLLALLLENCAKIELMSRGQVPGLIIPQHNLDITYPNEGPIEFILEAKAVGTPKHPGSKKAKPIGRAGSADLDKRVKEIGFKNIDLKGEYSRRLAMQGEGPAAIAGDLTTWLRAAKPKSFVCFAARVISDSDFNRVIRMAEATAQVSDAVGVFCFRPVSPDSPTTYVRQDVPPTFELDRVLFRACQELTRIKNTATSASQKSGS